MIRLVSNTQKHVLYTVLRPLALESRRQTSLTWRSCLKAIQINASMGP